MDNTRILPDLPTIRANYDFGDASITTLVRVLDDHFGIKSVAKQHGKYQPELAASIIKDAKSGLVTNNQLTMALAKLCGGAPKSTCYNATEFTRSNVDNIIIPNRLFGIPKDSPLLNLKVRPSVFVGHKDFLESKEKNQVKEVTAVNGFTRTETDGKPTDNVAAEVASLVAPLISVTNGSLKGKPITMRTQQTSYGTISTAAATVWNDLNLPLPDSGSIQSMSETIYRRILSSKNPKDWAVNSLNTMAESAPATVPKTCFTNVLSSVISSGEKAVVSRKVIKPRPPAAAEIATTRYSNDQVNSFIKLFTNGSESSFAKMLFHGADGIPFEKFTRTVINLSPVIEKIPTGATVYTDITDTIALTNLNQQLDGCGIYYHSKTLAKPMRDIRVDVTEKRKIGQAQSRPDGTVGILMNITSKVSNPSEWADLQLALATQYEVLDSVLDGDFVYVDWKLPLYEKFDFKKYTILQSGSCCVGRLWVCKDNAGTLNRDAYVSFFKLVTAWSFAYYWHRVPLGQVAEEAIIHNEKVAEGLVFGVPANALPLPYKPVHYVGLSSAQELALLFDATNMISPDSIEFAVSSGGGGVPATPPEKAEDIGDFDF